MVKLAIWMSLGLLLIRGIWNLREWARLTAMAVYVAFAAALIFVTVAPRSPDLSLGFDGKAVWIVLLVEALCIVNVVVLVKQRVVFGPSQRDS